jgi:hypothetical protein
MSILIDQVHLIWLLKKWQGQDLTKLYFKIKIIFQSLIHNKIVQILSTIIQIKKVLEMLITHTNQMIENQNLDQEMI